MHSVRRVEPSIWDTNQNKSARWDFCELGDGGGGTGAAYWYLWSEVPQDQPAAGPGRAVGTPCGTCCEAQENKERAIK